MIDIKERDYSLSLDEIYEYVNNPLFRRFCEEISETYKTAEKIEFSGCSMAAGWNIKFKKGGKSLCTIYPHESYFTVLIVISRKEKEAVEELLPEMSAAIRRIYCETPEGNGMKWLMIDLEDDNAVYRDALHLIRIRKEKK